MQGGDPENSERDGRDTCQLYIDTFYVSENFMKKYKISKKKGWPWCPQPDPKSAFGSRWLLFFTFIFNFGKRPFAILFWPVWALCNEGGKSWLIAVLYVAQLTKGRTEEVRTWKWCNDETSPLRRLEEKVITKEKFHYRKKGQWWPEENSTMKTLKTLNLRHGDSRQ